MVLLEKILGLIAPSICIGCGAEGQRWCNNCFFATYEKLPSACYRCNKASLDFKTCIECLRKTKLFALIPLFYFEAAPKKLVYETKIEANRFNAVLQGRLLALGLDDFSERWIVSYLPTSRKRARQRGFDHSKLIAKTFASDKTMEFYELLVRVGNARQVGSTRTEREANAKKMFVVNESKKELLKNCNILIFDDVVTTGASMESAARVLKNAGAKRVVGLCFAREK